MRSDSSLSKWPNYRIHGLKANVLSLMFEGDLGFGSEFRHQFLKPELVSGFFTSACNASTGGTSQSCLASVTLPIFVFLALCGLSVPVFIWCPRERARGHLSYSCGFQGGRLWLATAGADAPSAADPTGPTSASVIGRIQSVLAVLPLDHRGLDRQLQTIKIVISYLLLSRDHEPTS